MQHENCFATSLVNCPLIFDDLGTLGSTKSETFENVFTLASNHGKMIEIRERMKRMNEKIRDEKLDDLFRAILELQDLEECYAFFEDLCTVA